MKRFNLLIILSLCLYITAAAAAGWIIRQTSIKGDNEFKVEINRILDSLSGETTLDKLDLRSCEFINSVTFLPADELEKIKEAEAFFETQNHTQIELKPWFWENSFAGLLKFQYTEHMYNTVGIMLITQIFLGIMELFLLCTLLYLKYKLIRPFERVSSLPNDLAKGHLSGIVKEEKNQFLGHFLRGLGQLKDELAVSKKRQLELEKEKKKMLLSLSHDIKTPLHTIKLYKKALEKNLYQDEEQKMQSIHQIGEQAEEIERYIEELMKNFREDILDIQVKKGEFYLEDLMKRVLDIYEDKCRISMWELKVEKFSNLLLKGDPERSQEVFENIFENAFKYGDGRRIEITFYEEDYCHLIRIFNTGTPVTNNEFNHLFESFFRASNSHGMPGSGLGLYICREIMRKMDGDIFAQKEAEGMAFVLVFR